MNYIKIADMGVAVVERLRRRLGDREVRGSNLASALSFANGRKKED